MLFTRHTFVRSLHDLGAAAWFGGSLMGAVGLNGASEAIKDPSERLRVPTVGWARRWPVSAAAIGAHLVGGAALLSLNSPRVAAQKGVGTSTVLKMAATAGAIGATAYNGVLGAKIAQGATHEESSESAVTPSGSTPSDVAAAQKQQRILQWVTPALVGWVIVLGAQQGEMQRDSQLKKGLLGRILPG